LVAAHADSFGPMPAMTVRAVGVGAGGRDPAERANVLRLVLGEPVADAPSAVPRAVVMEANVDDMDPRVWPAALEALLAAGASDAWLTPILMKKGRPAHTVHVLCRAEAAEAVRAALLTHTATIGLRESTVDKHAADRRAETVEVDGQVIGVKVAVYGGRPINVSVENDDVVSAARRLGRPVKVVLAQATAAAARLYGGQ
ncbi:MAG: nickel insertion protein, partial [Stackebrandtia sp.]